MASKRWAWVARSRCWLPASRMRTRTCTCASMARNPPAAVYLADSGDDLHEHRLDDLQRRRRRRSADSVARQDRKTRPVRDRSAGRSGRSRSKLQPRACCRLSRPRPRSASRSTPTLPCAHRRADTGKPRLCSAPGCGRCSRATHMSCTAVLAGEVMFRLVRRTLLAACASIALAAAVGAQRRAAHAGAGGRANDRAQSRAADIHLPLARPIRPRGRRRTAPAVRSAHRSTRRARHRPRERLRHGRGDVRRLAGRGARGQARTPRRRGRGADRPDRKRSAQRRELDVLTEVARRFIHVAADQEHLALTDRATALAQQTLDAASERVAAARAPEVELRRARVAMARAQGRPRARRARAAVVAPQARRDVGRHGIRPRRSRRGPLCTAVARHVRNARRASRRQPGLPALRLRGAAARRRAADRRDACTREPHGDGRREAPRGNRRRGVRVRRERAAVLRIPRTCRDRRSGRAARADGRRARRHTAYAPRPSCSSCIRSSSTP